MRRNIAKSIVEFILGEIMVILISFIWAMISDLAGMMSIAISTSIMVGWLYISVARIILTRRR